VTIVTLAFFGFVTGRHTEDEQGFDGLQKSSFKGTVVSAEVGTFQQDADSKCIFKRTLVNAEISKLLLDAGPDGMFVLFTRREQCPDLLPRIKAALALACKCQLCVSQLPSLRPSFLCRRNPECLIAGARKKFPPTICRFRLGRYRLRCIHLFVCCCVVRYFSLHLRCLYLSCHLLYLPLYLRSFPPSRRILCKNCFGDCTVATSYAYKELYAQHDLLETLPFAERPTKKWRRRGEKKVTASYKCIPGALTKFHLHLFSQSKLC
jgi:hypothetical protein